MFAGPLVVQVLVVAGGPCNGWPVVGWIDEGCWHGPSAHCTLNLCSGVAFIPHAAMQARQ